MEQKQKDLQIDLKDLVIPLVPGQTTDQTKDQAITEYLQFFDSVLTEPYERILTANQTQSQKEGQARIQKLWIFLDKLASSCYEILRRNQFHIARQTHEGQKKSELNSVPFQMKVIRHIVTWEVIELYCRLGPIFKKFIVLNSAQSLKENNQMHSNQKLAHVKKNDQVYFLKFKQQSYAIKRVQFRKPNTSKNQIFDQEKISFSDMIREYFIASVISALRVGPYIKKVNGFDFIIHDSFIEFHMEQCDTFDTALIQEEMKRNLLVMHSLKICHMDVSPKNIMYSPTFKKWVFIDFGLSKMVKENIDKKSFTNFCGTCEYCSKEMKGLMNKHGGGQVNLYLNDVQGLKKSLADMKKIQIPNTKKTGENKQIAIFQTLLDTYRFLWKKILSLLYDNMKVSDESAFQNLKTQKKYHKALIIRICKFLVYCKKIYFWDQQHDITSIDNHEKAQQQAILNLPQSINQQLRTFAKIFDCFLDKEQVIKSYQEFYIDTDQLNESIDIENEIKKWESFYSAVTLPRDQQKQAHQNNSFDFQKDAIDKFSDLYLVQQSSCDSQQILTYLGYLFALVDFTSLKAFATPDLREKTFKTYFIIRTQLLQKISPQLKQFQTNSNFYPSSLYLSQFSPEILKFYDDMLRVILEAKEHSLQQSVQFEVRSLILRHGFQILKNLIFLGFNCFQFIKDYLAICFMFLVKTEDLKKHLILIMVRQTIEIGLLLEHCEIVVEKGKNFSNTSKHRLLNENILYFDQHQQFQQLMQNHAQLRQKILMIQEMWIFLNPEYAKFMLSYQHFYGNFNSIETYLLSEFRFLQSGEVIQRAKIYQETLFIVKQLPSTYFMIVQTKLNVLSQNISNANLQYERLIMGKNYGISFFTPQKQLIKMDVNFLLMISMPFDNKKRYLSTEKIINKIFYVSKLQHIFIFIFYRQQFIYSFFRGLIDNFFINMVNILVDSNIETLSLIGLFQKTILLLKQYPNLLKQSLGSYKYFRILWNYLIKSIQILADQAKNWQDHKIKVYEIYYINIAQNMEELFKFFCWIQQNIRSSKLSKEQKINLEDQINYKQSLSLIEQLQLAMEKFEENSLKDLKIIVFNRSILFSMKQFYFYKIQNCDRNKKQYFEQEYLPKLNWICKQLSQLHKNCWQSISFSSLGFLCCQSWYLTILNLLSKFQLVHIANQIHFIQLSSVYKMIRINNNFDKYKKQFIKLIKQINYQSQMPESQNYLIHSIILVYHSDVNLDNQKTNILKFQNKEAAIGNAIFYFKLVSNNLNESIVDYLVEKVILLKEIPSQFSYFVYLQLFIDQDLYFDSRKEKKLYLIRKLFLKLRNADLGKSIHYFLSHLYFQYRLCFEYFFQQNIVQREQKKFGICLFPASIIRKIIVNFATPSLFQTSKIKQCFMRFLESDYKSFNKKNKQTQNIFCKKIFEKKLMYLGQQLIPSSLFNKFITERSEIDFQQFKSYVKHFLLCQQIQQMVRQQYWLSFKYKSQLDRNKFIQVEAPLPDFSKHSQQLQAHRIHEFHQQTVLKKKKFLNPGDKAIYFGVHAYFEKALFYVLSKQNKQYTDKVRLNKSQIWPDPIKQQQVDESVLKYEEQIKQLLKLKYDIQVQMDAFGQDQDLLQKRGDDFNEFLRLKKLYQFHNYQI